AISIDADVLRHRRLVVADAGDQVQQAKRLRDGFHARAFEPEGRAGHDHRLHQLRPAVERVHQPRDAGARIEAAVDEAETCHRGAIEHDVHSLLSVRTPSWSTPSWSTPSWSTPSWSTPSWSTLSPGSARRL